jgi:hypothetical protein
MIRISITAAAFEATKCRRFETPVRIGALRIALWNRWAKDDAAGAR